MVERRVALVTGGGRGIGRAICLALAERGWFILINYQSNETAAIQTLAAVEAAGGEGFIFRADIGDKEERRLLLEELHTRCKRIDLLVNNASVPPAQRLDILETSEESYDRVVDTNLKATFFLTQAVARWMITLVREGVIPTARVINIGSISAYTASINRSEYCISKAGVAMLTKLFAERLAVDGITVHEIRPGIIATDMTAPAKEKYDHLIAEGLTPIRRWGQPEDVARTVVAIAEGYLPFSTGEVIDVDGGFHLKRL